MLNQFNIAFATLLTLFSLPLSSIISTQAFITDPCPNTISVIDTLTNQVTQTIPVPDATRLSGIAATPDAIFQFGVGLGMRL